MEAFVLSLLRGLNNLQLKLSIESNFCPLFVNIKQLSVSKITDITFI